MIIGDGEEDILLIRLADGCEKRLPYKAIFAEDFALQTD
jgi:hypothetical protein